MWSPDGKYLYFASDRGGQMNLWRVPIEESTGKVTGQPESLTTPSPYAQHLSFSRDGRRAVYVSQVSSKNILKANFKADTASLTGEPVAVARDPSTPRNPIFQRTASGLSIALRVTNRRTSSSSTRTVQARRVN